MSSGLNPERRVNKLGHVVTKHVRATGDGAKVVKMPIILSTTGDRMARVTILAVRFYGRYAVNLDHPPHEARRFREKIRSALAEFSDLGLSRVETMRSAADGALAGLLLARHSEQTVNDFLAVVDVMERERMSQSQMEQYLWSLHLTKELAPQGENGEYPEERGEQCLALIRVMRHMHWKQDESLILLDDEHGMEYPFISDNKLRGMIIGAGADREIIVQLVLERNILDADQLAELCSGVHSSLVEGGL